MTVDASAPGPCSDCGLCCNGVLFDRAKAAPGEEPRIVSAGAELFDENGKTYFRQPCPQSSGGRCMIYADRFTIAAVSNARSFARFERAKSIFPPLGPKVAGARTLLDRVIVRLARREDRQREGGDLRHAGQSNRARRTNRTKGRVEPPPCYRRARFVS